MCAPRRTMARPTTSSGPAGAVVEAIRMQAGLVRSRCCSERTTCFSSRLFAQARSKRVTQKQFLRLLRNHQDDLNW